MNASVSMLVAAVAALVVACGATGFSSDAPKREAKAKAEAEEPQNADAEVDARDEAGGSDTSHADTDAGAAAAADDDDDRIVDVLALAAAKRRPVDVVIVMDTSGSMGDKKSRLEASMGAFLDALFKANLDAHVTAIGSNYSFPSNLPATSFAVVPQSVDGPDVFEKLVSFVGGAYGQPLPLRKGAVLEAIGITDRNASGVTGEQVLAATKGREFHFTSIVGRNAGFGGGCFIVSAGTEFTRVAQATGGLSLDLCAFDGNALVQQVSAGIVEHGGGATFKLSHKPRKGADVEVEAGGKAISAGSYDVDYEMGTVSFADASVLGGAAKITVSYVP